MAAASRRKIEAKLTNGGVVRTLTGLTLPMIWGVFAIVVFNLVDTYFVSRLGTPELAAMTFTFPVVMVLGSIALGLGVGASSVIARAIGEGDHGKVVRLTSDSLSLSFIIVFVLALIGFLTIDPLFRALGADEGTLPLIREYMEIWYLGMVCLVIPMVGNSVIRAAGDTKIPALIMTVAAIINGFLDPVLIFGWWGFPKLGLKGAAIATVVARMTTLVASLAILRYREKMLEFKLVHPREFMWSCKQILYVGLPAAATNVISPFSIGVITALVASFGDEPVAGFGVATRIESVSMIVLMALAASVAPFVGQNWGAQLYDRVRRGLRASFLFSMLWGTVLAIILGFGAEVLTKPFSHHIAVIETATIYLMIVPLSFGILGVMMVSCSAFNAIGKPIPATVIIFTRMVVLYIPLAFLGRKLFGIVGIFGAACVSNIAVGLLAWLWNRRVFRKAQFNNSPKI